MFTFRLWLAVILVYAGWPESACAQTPSDLARGTDGMSSVAYYQLSTDAARLFQEKQYVASGDAYARLTAAYPHDGDHWYWLGRARYESGQFLEAARSFEKAHAMGTSATALSGLAQNGSASYAARAWARANQPAQALEWLERALLSHDYSGVSHDLLQDDAFEQLRQDSRFLKLAPPRVASNASRDEGWMIDLEYLITQIRRFHPQYAHPGIRDRIEASAASLRTRIPRLGDAQLAVEFQKLAALLGASHTEVFLHHPPTRFRFPDPLPVNLWFFPDGLYVVEAQAGLESLVGSRVTAIDGTPIERALEMLQPLVALEGEPRRLLTTRFLVLPHVLHALGVAREPTGATFTVTDLAGTTRTIELASRPDHQWRDALTPPPGTTAASLPLYLTRPNERFWFQHLAADDAVYVRIVMMRDSPDETLAAFGLRLRRFLEQHGGITNVIVDLRGNTGGQSARYPELLRTLVAFDARQDTRLITLIDRAVLSAAVNFAVDLGRLTNTVFVGEPTGGQPAQNGDPIAFRLPYTGILVILAAVEWNLSGPYDTRRWIAPDLPVALSAADYFANRDPILEQALALTIKNR